MGLRTLVASANVVRQLHLCLHQQEGLCLRSMHARPRSRLVLNMSSRIPGTPAIGNNV